MTSSQIFSRAAEAGINTAVLKFLHQLASFGATVLLVRALSQQEYGVYSILYATIPLLNVLASLGLPNVLQRYLPEYYVRKEFILGHRLFLLSILLRFVAGLFALFMVIIFWDRISYLLKISEYREYFLVFGVCIIAYQQWGMLTYALEAHFQHKRCFLVLIAVLLSRLAAYGVCLVEGYALFEIIIIDTVAYLIIAGLFLGLYVSAIPRTSGDEKKFSHKDKRRIMRYALFNNFNTVGIHLMGSDINYMIIAFFFSPREVAIFAFCSQLANRIARISPVSYLASVIRPAFFGIGISAKDERIADMAQLLFKGVFAFYVPVVFFCTIVGADFIDLVFGKFSEHAPIFVAAVSLAMIDAAGFPVGATAQLKERADIILYSKVFGALSLMLSVALIPVWGVIGAIVAIGVGTVLKNTFIGWFVRDCLRLTPVLGALLRWSLYWGLIGGTVFMLMPEDARVLKLLLSTAVFAAGFLGFVWWVLDLSAFEKRILHKVTQKLGAQRLVPQRLR